MQELLSVSTCRKQKTNQLIKFTIQPTRKPKTGPCTKPYHTPGYSGNKNKLRRRSFAVVGIGSIPYTLGRNTKTLRGRVPNHTIYSRNHRKRISKEDEVLLSLELAPSPTPWEEILRDRVPNHTIYSRNHRKRIRKEDEVLLSLELAPSPTPWEEIPRGRVPNHTIYSRNHRKRIRKEDEVLLSLELAPSPTPWEEILRDRVPNHTILQEP
jgi:hypothetical protein